MAQLDAIVDHLNTRRAALGRVERELLRVLRDRDLLRAEVSAIEKSIELLQGFTEEEPAAQPVTKKKKQNRTRSLSGRWRGILAAMASEHPTALGYDEITLLAEMEGHKITRENARSQMMAYANQELVERVTDGQFRLTEKGADAVGVALRNDEGSEVTSEPSEGDVAERSNAPDSKSGGAVPEKSAPVGSNPTVSAPFRRDLLSTTSAGPQFSTSNRPWKR